MGLLSGRVGLILRADGALGPVYAVDLDEIYDRFGVDYDLMSLLMSREVDEDGKFYISWGNQKIE